MTFNRSWSYITASMLPGMLSTRHWAIGLDLQLASKFIPKVCRSVKFFHIRVTKPFISGLSGWIVNRSIAFLKRRSLHFHKDVSTLLLRRCLYGICHVCFGFWRCVLCFFSLMCNVLIGLASSVLFFHWFIVFRCFLLSH